MRKISNPANQIWYSEKWKMKFDIWNLDNWWQLFGWYWEGSQPNIHRVCLLLYRPLHFRIQYNKGLKTTILRQNSISPHWARQRLETDYGSLGDIPSSIQIKTRTCFDRQCIFVLHIMLGIRGIQVLLWHKWRHRSVNQPTTQQNTRPTQTRTHSDMLCIPKASIWKYNNTFSKAILNIAAYRNSRKNISMWDYSYVAVKVGMAFKGVKLQKGVWLQKGCGCQSGRSTWGVRGSARLGSAICDERLP